MAWRRATMVAAAMALAGILWAAIAVSELAFADDGKSLTPATPNAPLVAQTVREQSVAIPQLPSSTSGEPLRILSLAKFKGHIFFAYTSDKIAQSEWITNSGSYVDLDNLYYNPYAIKQRIWFYSSQKLDKGDYSPGSGNDVYYFGKDCAAVTGLQTIKGKTYLFGKNGIMKTGVQKAKGKKYFFSTETGAKMTKSGIVTIKGKRYYFGKGGALPAKEGFKKVKGKIYYIRKDGSLQTGVATIKGKKYCFTKKGVMKTGFVKLNGKVRYFAKNGAMVAKAGFKTIDGKRYCFSRRGVVQTGFTKIKKKTYYFDKKGVMKTGVQTIDDRQYYFGENGVMRTGFVKRDGGLYFYDRKTGRMAGIGFEKGYIISAAHEGRCFKLRDYSTGDDEADESRVAKQIAKCSKVKGKDIDRVRAAAYYVAVLSAKSRYTMEGPDYYRAYGVFISHEYSCAGSTRALGMVLEYLGFSWEHANENGYTHQWCILEMDGKTGYADGQVGLVGYGSHPVES